MFCENCGSQVAGNSKFCEKCGAPMRAAGSAAVIPPPPPQSATAAPYSRPAYTQAPGYGPAQDEMTVGKWMITLLITAIPIVGIIMAFVWAFGSGAPLSKRNYFRAILIYALIAVVLYVIVFVVLAASLNIQGLFR